MKLIGFRELDFASAGFACNIPLDAKPYLTISPQVLYRVGTNPTFGPGQIGERTIPAEFSYRSAVGPYDSYEDAWSGLLARLRAYDTRPGELRAQRLDGTIVAIEAVLTMPNTGSFFGLTDVTSLPVVFVSVDPHWIALTEDTETKTFSSANDLAMSLPIETAIARPPTIEFRPTVQRASGTSTAGWKYRTVEEVANDTGRAMVNVAYPLDLGDTATKVAAGKMQADGDDVRIIRDGKEVARTLVGMNTADTTAWIVIPNLADGETAEYEVWYGNSAATTPTTLTGTSAPAIVLADSTINLLSYAVDDVSGSAGLGGWYLSSGTQTPQVSTDVPAAWRWVTTRPSPDDTWQDKYTQYTASGTKYRAIFAAQRARAASLPSQPEYADADGVMLYHPAGITNVRAGLQWSNQYEVKSAGNAVGRVVILSSQNGQAWNVVEEWSSVQTTTATVAAADYAISPAAPYVAFAVWPRSGDRVSSRAAKGRSVAANWDAELEITVQGANMPQTQTQAEEEIYEIALEYRLGGDADLDAPYRALRIGGASTRRFAVRLDERLRVYPGDKRADVYDSAGTSKVTDVPVSAIRAVEKISSAAPEQTSSRWLDVQPYVNPLANPQFATDVADWSRAATGTGVTANAPAFSSGRMRSQITASTLASGQIALQERADDFLPVAGKARISVAADLETDNTNLVPVPAIWFYDAAQSLIGSVDAAAAWSPVASTPARRVHSAAPPSNAAYYRVGVAVRTAASSATGSVYTDNVSPDGIDLIVDDEAIGTVEVSAGWLPQYI
jgi:hypothetical protein